MAIHDMTREGDRWNILSVFLHLVLCATCFIVVQHLLNTNTRKPNLIFPSSVSFLITLAFLSASLINLFVVLCLIFLCPLPSFHRYPLLQSFPISPPYFHFRSHLVCRLISSHPIHTKKNDDRKKNHWRVSQTRENLSFFIAYVRYDTPNYRT